PILPPGFCLLMAALSRVRGFGNPLRIALLALWGYVIAATYWLKLIPMYTGYPSGRVRAGEIWGWYRGGFAQTGRILDTIALIPSAAIWTLAAAVALGAVSLVAALSVRNGRRPNAY